MKYHPNLIIYKVFLRYLSDSDKVKFENSLQKFADRKSKHFYNCMLKNFDIELLRTHSLIWEDIWIYNYCKYEVSDRIKRTGLISKYEKEVFIIDEDNFKQLLIQRKLTN